MLAFSAVVTVLGFVFYEDLHSKTGWCAVHGTGSGFFNVLVRYIPNAVYTVQILFLTLFILYLFCLIVAKIFKGTPRRVTIGKLIKSIFKAVIWIACVIAVLAVWGLDVAALIAGAGVITLIIGLGMQSLIADVVAGIFLVCDGTLQVGDTVIIDGWRGTVQEIGIRNTTLVNFSGDIRVANNSTIKVFVNQSRNNSYPTVTIGIEYGEDIKRVEEIFAANKEKIRAEIPLILDGPDYKGVDGLDASSVNLLFGATCKEESFFQVQRDLKRALKLMFDENGINIPFPQIVVNHRENEEK